MIPQATLDLDRATRRRILLTLVLLHREWARRDPFTQWETLRPRLEMILAAAMVAGAREGAASVPLALSQTGFPTMPVATVSAAAFGLAASDGRPLATLLDSAIIRARTAQAVGHPSPLDAALARLDRIARTQVADATREATGTAITATPNAGWVRVVNVPCCQDCAVQAGRWFRDNEGFQRHPNCMCQHRPAHERETPAGYAVSIEPDQIHDLTAAQREALDEGADLSRVVNAYRGADGGARPRMTTTTEMGRRSGARLTPDGIRQRGRTREERIALLVEHGYLTT